MRAVSCEDVLTGRQVVLLGGVLGAGRAELAGLRVKAEPALPAAVPDHVRVVGGPCCPLAAVILGEPWLGWLDVAASLSASEQRRRLVRQVGRLRGGHD